VELAPDNSMIGGNSLDAGRYTVLLGFYVATYAE